MSDEFSSNCSICQHSYDEGVIRQGLLLPCGHPFCRCCLQKLEDNCNKNCPMCRHDWSNARVSVLPEYTPVGGSVTREVEEEEEDADEDTCKKHGFEFPFWCQSCEVSICKYCLKEGHKRCDWLFLEDALDAINGWVKQNAGSASSRLLAALEGVQKRRAKCSEELVNMRYFRAAVEESERQLVAYSAKLASLESKMSKGVEELKRTGETADTLSIQALQRSKRLVEQLGKAVDVPQSPKLHMSAVAQAYKGLEGKHCGADFLSELSSEVLKSSLEVEALMAEEERSGTPQAEAETAAGVVKITAEMATQVEPEEVYCRDEDGGPVAPPPCTRCSAGDAPNGASLPDGEDWDIADPDTAAAAVTRLLATRVRPSCVTLTVDASWHQLQVTNLLKVLGHKPCSVRLKFLDTFMLLGDEGEKKDEERLNALRFGDHKCTIEEFWGCLSFDKLKEFLSSPVLKIVALPLSSADDAKVLTALQSSHKEEGLSELHLHLSQKIKLEHITPLDVSRLKNLSRCYLHCPLVVGDDLNWLVEVVDKLVSAEGRKMWSMVLSLPSHSLTAADLDRIMGLLRDHDLTDLSLQIDSNLDRSQQMEISHHSRKSCSYILWYTEYALPIKMDQSSVSVGSSLTRSTLPVLLTLHGAKELLKEVLAVKLSELAQKTGEMFHLGAEVSSLPITPTQFHCQYCDRPITSIAYVQNGKRINLPCDELISLYLKWMPVYQSLLPVLHTLSQSLEALSAPSLGE